MFDPYRPRSFTAERVMLLGAGGMAVVVLVGTILLYTAGGPLVVPF